MSDFREVLYTVDKGGSRRWVYNLVEKSGWYRARKVTAWILMAIYLLAPWVTVNGKQAVLLDIPARKFTLLGATFWATDTIYLFFVLAALALALFLFTAVFGRIWCGWACPETVFLEFLFRPIEILIEGSADQRRRLDASSWDAGKVAKKAFKFLVFSAIAWILSSTALSMFLGRDRLWEMIQHSPAQNPAMFMLTLAMMGVILFQFGWFREQFCTIVCPYGRLQAVLLDENSVLVGYDRKRGEPRGKFEKTGIRKFGDCVDCDYCVRVCPTGIDIRNGLQLECIQCAQCADACDSVMTKLGRPAGLIRYDTGKGLLGERTSFLRPRVVLYFLALAVCFGAFYISISNRTSFECQVIRGAGGAPYTLRPDGKIINRITLNISNKGDKDATFDLGMTETKGISLVTPVNPFPVKAGEIGRAPLIFIIEKEALKSGKANVSINIAGPEGKKAVEKATLLGPG